MLEIIPENIIGALELKDAELIKNLAELDLAGFSPKGKEGSGIQVIPGRQKNLVLAFLMLPQFSLKWD